MDPQHRLVLEVAGSSLATDLRVGLEILTRLRLLGFGLSVNAFGPHELPPARLRDIPFSELKLDRAFVMGLPDDRKSLAIVRTVTQLAKDLGMSVVAEGVETRAQQEALCEAGVTSLQGFLLSHPLTETDLDAWLGAPQGA